LSLHRLTLALLGTGVDFAGRCDAATESDVMRVAAAFARAIIIIDADSGARQMKPTGGHKWKMLLLLLLLGDRHRRSYDVDRMTSSDAKGRPSISNDGCHLQIYAGAQKMTP
jgi:hypothetical protein